MNSDENQRRRYLEYTGAERQLGGSLPQLAALPTNGVTRWRPPRVHKSKQNIVNYGDYNYLSINHPKHEKKTCVL